MFKGKTFYNEHIRKAIIAFGTIFNNINIERKNADGDIIQTLRVPLAYSTKQKFLSRIEQIPTVQSRGEVAIVLPRMGFEISSLQYDAQRKISPIQVHKKATSSATSVAKTFVSTPYDLTLSLYLFAKNQEDGLRIIEQILPYFNPDFNITVNDLPDLGIKRDIKIILDSIGYEDNTQGSFADRQSIVWTLTFTMKLNFYGYVGNQDVIRKAIVQTYQNPNLVGAYTEQKYSVTSATATATATISGDAIDSIAVTYKGEGYSESGPNITLSGNGRAHAVMELDPLNSGKYRVASVVIDDAGSGYSSAPTVTFEPPDDGNQGVDDTYRFLEEFDQSYD